MSTYNVTSSSELMQNYIQSDILEPQKKFIALQTDTGASLLFSIGTDDVFYVTKELPGAAHGWGRADLSSAQAKKDFTGNVTCKTFAAAQAVVQQSAAIHLAMALNDGTNDHLYLSLTNSDSDTGWTDKPAWTPCPFNAKDSAGAPIQAPAPFKIANVFISEATDKEYIVVDIIRNPSGPAGLVSRFYIDASTPADPVWVAHDIAIDLEAASYASCLGRSSHAFGVDGLYTTGTIAKAPQLIYTPLYNAFDPNVPAAPSRLTLPGNATADAIAACRNADNSSDLYVVAQGNLYYFASTNQKDNAVGTLLASYDLLSGVRELFAYAADGSVTVWGLNGSDEVFYLTCGQTQITTAGGWSRPISILTGVDAISPYIDRRYSANTFFAHGADGLIKAVKTPATGIWGRRNITLPPSDQQQSARRISSYTTRIQVNGSDGQAAADVPVSLTATSVTSVYINHLYYIVGPTPIQVATDALGSVTIVELTQTLAGTRFTATVDAVPLPINPLDAPFQRSAKLDSVDRLKGAVITNQDGSTRLFVPDGTSSKDLDAVAQSNQGLGKAYAKFATSPSPRPMRAVMAAPGAMALPHAADGILTDIGDLVSWLESGVKSVVSVVEDVAHAVWHLVVSIGDKIYHGILDSVEKVVAAAVWIYKAIKVVVDDIIKLLEFLFSWRDILVTHRVMKNVFIQLVQHSIDGLDDVKADLSSLFKQVQADIDKWADIPNFDQTPSGTTSSNPPLPGQNDAPANLGFHHFQGNCHNSQSSYQPPAPAEAIFKDLLELLEKEGAALKGAYEAIRKDIIDQFNSLSVTEIIKRFAAIVSDALLQTAENILLAVLDIFIQLTKGMMDLLSAKIRFPVISTLYHDLTGDDLSFLDLMCLIAAIPATLIYKATTKAKAPPFPHGDAFTNALIEADSFAQIRNAFFVPKSLKSAATRQPPTTAVRDPVRAMAAAGETPVLNESYLKGLGFVIGCYAFLGSRALIITNTIQKLGDELNPQPLPKTLAAIACVGNILYVSPNIPTLINARTDNWYSQMNNVLTGISILKGIVAVPLAESENVAIQKAFPTVETVINIAWNLPVIMNIVASHAKFDTTYKSLIPESIGNFAFNLGGMMDLPIEFVDDPKIKAILVGEQSKLMEIYGVLMVVAGGIYEWAPNQSH